MTKKKQTRKNSTKENVLQELINTPLTLEDRNQLIAEAAYFRAEQRGFYPEEHEQDWFEAEKIVDSMLSRGMRESTESVN
jgi:hypothetical protein